MKQATLRVNNSFKGLIDYKSVKFQPNDSGKGWIELRDENDHLFMYVYGEVTIHQNDIKDSDITINLAE